MPDVAVPPPELSTFVGRARELDEIADLVAPGRLVTLVGPGGCGKTRLAARFARTARGLPDDARWVELEHESDADAVATGVARQLGVLVPAGAEPLTVLVEQLRVLTAVLVLDNCEHVADAAAQLVRAVLTHCPGIAVVATSRGPLDIPGEVVWRVPPLALEDAVALLTDRAGTAARALSPETARRICDRLDRLPLGLELAAGWMGTLSASQIAEALREPLALLGDAAGRGTLRQQSLEASIRWSHDLLTRPEQVAFQRLAGLEPGFTAVLATRFLAVLGQDPATTLGVVRRLLDASLLVADTGGPVATYRMLGVVRAYAQSRLDATELGVVRDAQLDAALTAVAELAPLLTTDKDTWRAEIRQLYPNLRSATAWGLSRADPSRGRRLAAGLAWWWHLESGGREGLRFLERAVELGAGERNLLQAEVLVSAALVADTAVGGGAGYRYAEAAAGLAGELVAEDDRQGQALGGVSRLSRALVAIGLVGTDLGAAERVAVAVRDEAMTAGDGFVTDAAQALVGLVTMLRDVYPDAIDALEAPLASLLARGDRGVASMALGALAMANARCMRFEEAARRAEEAVAVAEPLRDFHRIGSAWCTLADVRLCQGRVADARAALARIDGVVQGADPAPFIPRYELTHAILALEEGRLEEAVAWCRRESRWSSEPSEANLTVRTQLVLAIAQIWLGDHAAAAVVVERLQSSEQAPRLPLYWAESLNVQAILLHDADPEAALDLHLEALRYGLDSDFDMGLIYCLEAIIACHLHRGDLDRAAVLTGAVDRGREESGFWASSYVPDPRQELGERMPEAPLIDALARGRSMDLRQAAAWVTRSRGPRRRPGAGWASLTPTEVEVATLAAEGLTNPQIAERLFVSRSTVKTHLEHVYAKLGIAGRTELARMVAERDGRR